MLQYSLDSLTLSCESDRSLNPGEGVVAYGSKGDFILHAMVVFYVNDL